MYLVGTVYNFCRVHASLRVEQRYQQRRWQERIPAIAAELTEHVWSVAELLWCCPLTVDYTGTLRHHRTQSCNHCVLALLA